MDLAEAAVAETRSTLPARVPDDAGWYLYGITRRSTDAEGLEPLSDAHDDAESPLGHETGHERLQLLGEGNLAAVIRRVRRSDYTAEALQAHLSDPDCLEMMVRRHNAVIAGIHQEQAILPSRFGGVYARTEDVAAAMREHHDALLAQVEWLDGCDEWAVHVYVDPQGVRARVRAEQAAEPLQHQLAGARPGRAYFLRRKLEDELTARISRKTEELAHAANDGFARLAIATRAERPAHLSGGDSGDIEVLRAALLVHRERRDELVAELGACAEEQDGWRCAYSGPWPPYSFAAFSAGSDDDRHDA